MEVHSLRSLTPSLGVILALFKGHGLIDRICVEQDHIPSCVPLALGVRLGDYLPLVIRCNNNYLLVFGLLAPVKSFV